MHLGRERATILTTALRSGFAMLPRDPRQGMKRVLLPVSYWRLAEFAYVWHWLDAARGARVLDVGSPKELGYLLALHRSYEVVSCDILDSEVEQSRRYAAAQHLLGTGAGTVTSLRQDARALDFPDASFHAACCVSVIEHIPDNGDSRAIRELMRVVKPGGRVVITTPFEHAYRETHIHGQVYERRPEATEAIFYERHYDHPTLQERLIAPSGGKLLNLELWGEGILRMERMLGQLGPIRTILSPVEPLLSLAFLRRIAGTSGHPMAVFFVLQVP
jgi:SAM-dependent methyltransferase